SVDRGDHRLRHLAKIAHAFAGHARELVHVACRSFQELGNDLVDIPSRAESAALAPDHEHPDLFGTSSKLACEVADIGVDVEGQRVEPLGPRKGECRDTVGLVIVEMRPPTHRCRTATASTSTIAAGSNRELTSTSVDAG